MAAFTLAPNRAICTASKLPMGRPFGKPALALIQIRRRLSQMGLSIQRLKTALFTASDKLTASWCGSLRLREALITPRLAGDSGLVPLSAMDAFSSDRATVKCTV